MKTRTEVTLVRVYSKSITLELEKELYGLDPMDYPDAITDELIRREEEIETLFEATEYDNEMLDVGGVLHRDTDRYDMYLGEKHIYGGHL